MVSLTNGAVRRAVGTHARRGARSRRACIAPRAALERPVFRLSPSSNSPDLTLEDLRDAYEVCSLIPSTGERSECYSCFGIDGQRMGEYYDKVLSLESMLSEGASTAPGGGGGGFGGGGGQGGPGGPGGLGGLIAAGFGAFWFSGHKAAHDPDDAHSATASMAE